MTIIELSKALQFFEEKGASEVRVDATGFVFYKEPKCKNFVGEMDWDGSVWEKVPKAGMQRVMLP